MGRLGLAGLSDCRDRLATSYGAALTCCCYGLFTLVGITGEDDLEAPDLIGPDAQVYCKRK